MEQVAMALRSAYYPANGDTDWAYGFQHEDGGDGDAAKDRISWVKIGSSLVGEDVPWAGAAHRVNLFVDARRFVSRFKQDNHKRTFRSLRKKNGKSVLFCPETW